MGRSPRYAAPDTVYHVICRGNNRQDIFIDNHDYFKYLELWRKYKNELAFEVYAYVLMTNHVHWLIKTGPVSLSEIMHRVHSTYARWFNHRHDRVGHLFQDRYKSIICSSDSYILMLARYIHLNPVRAGLVPKIHIYPWSSYPSYCGRDDPLVNTRFLLSYFSQDIQKARLSFIQFIQEGIDSNEAPMEKPPSQKEKRQLMPSTTAEPATQISVDESSGKSRKSYGEINLDNIAAWIQNATGVTVQELREKSQKRAIVLARNLFIRIAVGEAGIKRSRVAKYLDKDRSLITKVLEKWANNDMPAPANELLQQFICNYNFQPFNTWHHSRR